MVENYGVSCAFILTVWWLLGVQLDIFFRVNKDTKVRSQSLLAEEVKLKTNEYMKIVHCVPFKDLMIQTASRTGKNDRQHPEPTQPAYQTSIRKKQSYLVSVEQ